MSARKRVKSGPLQTSIRSTFSLQTKDQQSNFLLSNARTPTNTGDLELINKGCGYQRVTLQDGTKGGDAPVGEEAAALQNGAADGVDSGQAKWPQAVAAPLVRSKSSEEIVSKVLCKKNP